MQWHQLDHMQTICTSLETDNNTNTSSLNFYRTNALTWRLTNSVKALKARITEGKVAEGPEKCLAACEVQHFSGSVGYLKLSSVGTERCWSHIKTHKQYNKETDQIQKRFFCDCYDEKKISNVRRKQHSLNKQNKKKFNCFCLTHTHTRLMALFPGLPGWASTRKVKPIWILLEQETVSGNGISWTICKSASRSRQITMPAPHRSSFFTGRMPFLPPNQQRQSTEGTVSV